MFGRKEINVNIVTGDINNSEITFVRITDPDGWERQFESKSLFTTIFTEFLGLPSLQELEWQSKVRSAIRKGRIKEYRKVFDLWRDVSMGGMRGGGEPLSKGTVIRLSDIQLTEFVNRNPGYCYTGNLDERWRRVWDGALLTPSFAWQELAHTRSRSVSLLGLGDVRFTKAEHGLYLLNCISSGSARWATELEASRSRDPIDLKREIDYYYQVSENYSYLEDVKSKALERLPLVLGQKLYDFTQNIRVYDLDIDQLSLGGFPVLVTKKVYEDIADHLQKYGAAALQSIEGMLIAVPEYFSLNYARGVPKWCLLVGSPKHIQGIRIPEPIVCSAWTVTIDDSLKKGAYEKYLQWMFKVGVEDWHSQLQEAVEVIEIVRSKISATALFEFDEERNWFDPYTPFTPRTMRELFQKMKQKEHRGLQLFLEPGPTSSAIDSKYEPS